LTALAALLGALCALAVVTAVLAVSGALPERRPRPPRAARRWDRFGLRVGAAFVAGVLTGVQTGWPVGSVLVAGAAFMAPSAGRGRKAREAETTRLEAIATWTEMLRDIMAGAGGLGQAIMATAPLAPPAIRTEVAALAARAERDRLAPALRSFADELADPTGDLVVAALLLAAEHSPKRLPELLSRLAMAARQEVDLRLDVEGERARTRSAVRIIMMVVVAFSLFLAVMNRPYVEAYSSALGQAVLVVVFGLYAAAFAWFARASRVQRSERLLANVSDSPAAP
jgi:tight adherence protein B